jgi:uncharacterized protein (DUF2141 family)
MSRSLFISLGLLLGASQAAHAGDLSVTVHNLQSEQGQIRISLYNRADNWLGRHYKRVSGPAGAGSVTLTFTDVPSGEYALALYHDVNGDGKLATNLIGIPSEPVGFSNDARGTFGPPAYDDVKLQVTDVGKAISITLF